MPDIKVRISENPVVDVWAYDLGDGTHSFENPGAGAGGGLTDTQLRATPVPVSGPLTDAQIRATPIEVLSAEAEGGWVPRSNDAAADTPIPGFYVVCTLANTAYKVDRPTGAKSLLLWFAASGAFQTPLDGRIAFARDETAPPAGAAADTTMGYHPPLPIEYSPPADVTDVYVASQTAGRVALGQWTYE